MGAGAIENRPETVCHVLPSSSLASTPPGRTYPTIRLPPTSNSEVSEESRGTVCQVAPPSSLRNESANINCGFLGWIHTPVYGPLPSAAICCQVAPPSTDRKTPAVVDRMSESGFAASIAMPVVLG